MFKDTPEGQTHFMNDGCGEPAHNMNPDSSYIKEFGDLRFKYLEAAIKGPGLNEATDNLVDWLRKTLATVRKEERARCLKILEKEIALAHTEPSGTTSRLTSAYERIARPTS